MEHFNNLASLITLITGAYAFHRLATKHNIYQEIVKGFSEALKEFFEHPFIKGLITITPWMARCFLHFTATLMFTLLISRGEQWNVCFYTYILLIFLAELEFFFLKRIAEA